MSLKDNVRKISLASLLFLESILPVGLEKSLCPYPARLEDRLQKESIVKNHLPDKYGVIIISDDEERHAADCSILYQTLIENNYKKENIYILTQNGKEKYVHPVDDVASRESLLILFKHLSEKIDEKDKLFFAYIDHGQVQEFSKGLKEIKLSGFSLRDKWVNEMELEFYFSTIKAKEEILIFDCCYSGGFPERLGKENTIALSSSKIDEESFSSIDDSFVGSFSQAFRKNSDANLNHDRFTSVLEAHNYAKQNHSWSKRGKQHPQIKYDKTKIDANNVGL